MKLTALFLASLFSSIIFSSTDTQPMTKSTDFLLPEFMKADDPRLTPDQQKLIDSARDYDARRFHKADLLAVKDYKYQIRKSKNGYKVYIGSWSGIRIELDPNGKAWGWEIVD
jgi:hypothetical protein